MTAVRPDPASTTPRPVVGVTTGPLDLSGLATAVGPFPPALPASGRSAADAADSARYGVSHQ